MDCEIIPGTIGHQRLNSTGDLWRLRGTHCRVPLRAGSWVLNMNSHQLFWAHDSVGYLLPALVTQATEAMGGNDLKQATGTHRYMCQLA
jgi:hypothetical protein